VLKDNIGIASASYCVDDQRLHSENFTLFGPTVIQQSRVNNTAKMEAL